MAFRDIKIDDFVKIRRPSQPHVHGRFGDVIEIGSVYYKVRMSTGEENWFGNNELLIADRDYLSRYTVQTVEELHTGESEYEDPEQMEFDVLIDHVYELRSEIARLKSELQHF